MLFLMDYGVSSNLFLIDGLFFRLQDPSKRSIDGVIKVAYHPHTCIFMCRGLSK